MLFIYLQFLIHTMQGNDLTLKFLLLMLHCMFQFNASASNFIFYFLKFGGDESGLQSQRLPDVFKSECQRKLYNFIIT